MRVSVIKWDKDGNNKKILGIFDNMDDALNCGSKAACNRLPLQIDKFTFLWDSEDVDIFTQMVYFYSFRTGNIVQSNNNFSTYRFTDGEIIECYAEGFYPMYVVRLSDGFTKAFREKDLRIQRI